MKLSIVTTMYRSAPFLKEFHTRVRGAAEAITDEFEIIYVNDGSPDASLQIAKSLLSSDPRVRIIDLSRNFGHHRAIMTGLAQARGEFVFLIDCDLEEQPESLSLLFDRLMSADADVIYGAPANRKGGWFERSSGWLFWRGLKLLMSEDIPAKQTTMRLMKHRYVAALMEHRDKTLFLPGVWATTGFTQIPCVVPKYSRKGSSYTLRRKIAQAVDSITSFSTMPLVAVFYLGAFIVLAATIAASYLIVRRILFQEYLAGWPSLIVSIWLLGGLTIFCIGVVGIYLSKIFAEVKDRPTTVIREILERSDKAMEEFGDRLPRTQDERRGGAAHEDFPEPLTHPSEGSRVMD